MGRIVIACYKPKPQKAAELAALMRTHLTKLRAEGLVTSRASVMMTAEDGTVIEVVEWASADAIARSHQTAELQALWDEYLEVCEYLPLAEVAGTDEAFAEFEPAD